DLFANAIGNITAHEAGHFFGAWHTDNANEHLQIMDTGGNGIQDDTHSGVDRILGTQDDVGVDFGEDEYQPGERYHGGHEDTINAFAFGLSTGTGRGGNAGGGNAAARERMARGIVWRDANNDGNIDLSERGIGGITIYADENNNKRFDIGEPASKTDASGNYRITDINRERTQIRILLNPGLVPTSPADGSHDFVRGEELANKNFGVTNGQGTDEGYDYGNAPAPYPTGGVRHGVVAGLSLGSAIDGEAGPQANDDADGVQFLDDVYAGGRSTIEVTVSNGDQPGALLQAWIDFDGDGTWSTPGEQIVSNKQMSEGVNTLSFDVPEWAINSPSVARFRYGYEPNLSFTGSSIAGEVEDYNINIEQTGPDAAADSYEFRRNTGEHRLAVLNNDSVRSGGLRIQSVTSPSGGGSATIDSSRTALVYEAAMNYAGTETFTYTVVDANGLTDSANISVTTTSDFVTIRLVATDVDGNPISRLAVDSDFLLQAYVQDLRSDATGVHSAFLDVNYSSVLANPTGSISYGDSYPNARSGNIDPGRFDEIGAIAALDRLDGAERLLFSVPMEATAAGTVNFIGTPADLSPAHDVLLFDVNQFVPTGQIEYRPYSLTISDGIELSTSTNPVNAMDVNDDDNVSPIDALLVINDLNGQAAARTAGSNHYLDVSGDGAISPIDALLVINYLNRPTTAAAVPSESRVAGALDASTESTIHSGPTTPGPVVGESNDSDARETEIRGENANESVFVRTVSDEDRDDAIASVLDELEDHDLI
ncbi:GEVED domain-containing protein, partial [Planctomycetota bacterium]